MLHNTLQLNKTETATYHCEKNTFYLNAYILYKSFNII